MVSATLAFGRDTARAEPARPVDLGSLLRTVTDDAADARPDAAERIALKGVDGEHVTVRGRPIALKRTFANLVGNALVYGGSVTVVLHPPGDGEVTVLVEDDGPGIPPGEFERGVRAVPAAGDEPIAGDGWDRAGTADRAATSCGRMGGRSRCPNRAQGGLCAKVVLPL